MEVINKFTDLLIRGIKKKKKRKKTSPTKSSIEKRLLKKKKRSSIKNLRKKPSLDEH
jgi:ribosome-associated protein